jgi:hypothetical protein
MRPRLSREFLTLGGAILSSLSTGYSSEAQGQNAVPSDEDFRWEATVVLGRAWGGPGDDIEEMLRASGWVGLFEGVPERPRGAPVPWR